MLYPSIYYDNLFDDWFDDDFFWPALPDIRQLEKEERKAEKESNRLNRRVFGRHAANLMKTDVKETDGGYEVSVDLPGFKKEDVSCELKDGYLIISATKGNENGKNDKDDKYLRRERYTGSVQRSFYVGDALTENDIKAKFEHGVLTLDLPKAEEQKKVEDKHLIQIAG